MEIAVIVTLWIACGVFASVVATSKRRNGLAWFAVGVLFGPLALVSIGFMPVLGPIAMYDAHRSTPCARCGTLNSIDASYCVSCGVAVGK